MIRDKLGQSGHKSELIYIKSEGDADLIRPLHGFGTTGIFTRALDEALMGNHIDLAVHSYKDLPTRLADGLIIAAVPERGDPRDVLVLKGDRSFLDDLDSTAIVATGSLRRKAAWLNRYRNHTIEPLRGNVPGRLKKLSESNWSGAIFAAAGLVRLNAMPENVFYPDWMIPARWSAGNRIRS
jgi:hydroxymethylbilane synthase